MWTKKTVRKRRKEEKRVYENRRMWKEWMRDVYRKGEMYEGLGRPREMHRPGEEKGQMLRSGKGRKVNEVK